MDSPATSSERAPIYKMMNELAKMEAKRYRIEEKLHRVQKRKMKIDARMKAKDEEIQKQKGYFKIYTIKGLLKREEKHYGLFSTKKKATRVMDDYVAMCKKLNKKEREGAGAGEGEGEGRHGFGDLEVVKAEPHLLVMLGTKWVEDEKIFQIDTGTGEDLYAKVKENGYPGLEIIK